MKSLTFNEDLIKNRTFQRIFMKSFTFNKDLWKNRTFQRICMKSLTFNKDTFLFEAKKGVSERWVSLLSRGGLRASGAGLGVIILQLVLAMPADHWWKYRLHKHSLCR